MEDARIVRKVDTKTAVNHPSWRVHHFAPDSYVDKANKGIHPHNSATGIQQTFRPATETMDSRPYKTEDFIFSHPSRGNVITNNNYFYYQSPAPAMAEVRSDFLPKRKHSFDNSSAQPIKRHHIDSAPEMVQATESIFGNFVWPNAQAADSIEKSLASGHNPLYNPALDKTFGASSETLNGLQIPSTEHAQASTENTAPSHHVEPNEQHLSVAEMSETEQTTNEPAPIYADQDPSESAVYTEAVSVGEQPSTHIQGIQNSKVYSNSTAGVSCSDKQAQPPAYPAVPKVDSPSVVTKDKNRMLVKLPYKVAKPSSRALLSTPSTPQQPYNESQDENATSIYPNQFLPAPYPILSCGAKRSFDDMNVKNTSTAKVGATSSKQSPTPESMPRDNTTSLHRSSFLPTSYPISTGGAERLSDEMKTRSGLSSQVAEEAITTASTQPSSSQSVPRTLSSEDEKFIKDLKADLDTCRPKKKTTGWHRQTSRIRELLEVATPPHAIEALFLSGDEAAEQVACGKFFPGPIFTEGQQPLTLQTTEEFLQEYYDDDVEVWIQDPSMKLSNKKPHTKKIKIGKLKERFAQPKSATDIPWNCLELATHVEDGLRPAFLNGEDCRLLTKLQLPGSGDSASRRGYLPGWKDVEKWALVAQGGALTEPHQDSHGYGTYITVNQGVMGFGWLANPTAEERKRWRANPAAFMCDKWRFAVLRPGQTVLFPSGTVHFVFRLRSAGDTLAFGGHVLRCSQIVGWLEAMLEEKAGPDVTNEDLTVSAPAYLARVEKFVKQALKTGQVEKWGGSEAIEKFLKLKKEFLGGSS